MEYLQYLGVVGGIAQEAIQVLNLIINGIPSIQMEKKLKH